ncbi:MAG: VOC family protein [bacterium]|nr:VOC family protein [bacterium]
MQPTNKVMPHIIVSSGQEALNWYRDVLGAEITHVMPGPGGVVAHAGFVLGNTTFFLTDMTGPQTNTKSPSALNGQTSVSFYANVDDVDGLYTKAIKAGAKSVMEPQDAFWGDRWANVIDPFGHNWQFGKNQEQVTPEEMNRRMTEMMSKGGM